MDTAVSGINVRPWMPFENRCDACGAESWVRLQRIIPLKKQNTHVQEMYFCGHHGRKYGKTMEEQGWDGDDYTSQINEKPSISANV